MSGSLIEVQGRRYSRHDRVRLLRQCRRFYPVGQRVECHSGNVGGDGKSGMGNIQLSFIFRQAMSQPMLLSITKPGRCKHLELIRQ